MSCDPKLSPFAIAVSRPAISQHLAILLRTRIGARAARRTESVVTGSSLSHWKRSTTGWLYERFWSEQAGALGEHLRKHS